MSASPRHQDRIHLDRAAFKAALTALALALPGSGCGSAPAADASKTGSKPESKGDEIKAADGKAADGKAQDGAGGLGVKPTAATGGAEAPPPSKADGDEGPAPTQEVL